MIIVSNSIVGIDFYFKLIQKSKIIGFKSLSFRLILYPISNTDFNLITTTLKLTIANIIPQIHAQFIGKDKTSEIDAISTDSRSLQNNSTSLFFALVGPNNDAHDYIEELIRKGVCHFVVQKIPKNIEGKANFLLVKDTLNALQEFAAYYNHLYQFPIIGITGSNGKTIIKEWLNFLLSPDYNIIRNPKSYNSQVGVPLSVLGMNRQHNLGLFEAGISTVGEMEKLENIIQPTIGILTNIGSAHDEGFKDNIEKTKEKLILFKNVSTFIYQKNPALDLIINGIDYLKKTNLFNWSFDDKEATVFISEKKKRKENTTLNIWFKNTSFKITIPFLDKASVENTIHCLMVLLYLNYDVKTIQNRIKLLYPIEMRLRVKKGGNNTTIIDDSYSSDFQSLKIALDFLEHQKQHKNKTVILSDIFQSGLELDELYKKVADLLASNHIDRLIGIGSMISKFANVFKNSNMYVTTADFITDFEKLSFENESILVKGARSFHFEDIVTILEEKTHETVFEINLNAISHNLNYFRSKLNTNTKLMIMVKAFSYGSGGFEIAKLLEYHKVDYLGVAFADEGIALRNAGIKMPIMVLNPEKTSFPSLISYHLEPEIYSIKGLNAFLKITANKNLKQYPIHIKLDTGMHRLGFEKKDMVLLIQTLKNTPSVKVKSIFSHLASSDNLKDIAFTYSQITLFESLSSALITELKINPLRHILNTSGIRNFTNAQFDMVRLGIGLYGVSYSTEEAKNLENVGTLKSIISQIKTIQKGDSVGYNRRFIAKKTTKSATIPIGYADGIPRAWGNSIGSILINNKEAPILGDICMDMLMVDVTHIDCKEGDTVIIFGKNPSVSHMAKKLNTIPYEILTSVSQRVKRIFYRE